ncbi:MGDG synthase family glycosyltransferase [Tepidibacillus sp. HK-1]|uniref:MGDG synthase family glycosyltransferase n=1 Tax=Tepidibacillus sp. HK-1 TaxID=1883407 RepID=UPI000853BF34|nr:glycosyltransferase [Tepidibacillus sp. HK-1]GBF11907.1 processive diacylglycerol beta-glucosyltransferase [Tepidibacillus sp. HK-1]
MSGKRILILSESFGAGHTRAAEAIKEGILSYHPDWQIHVLELGTWLRPTLSHWITEIYLKTLRFSPKIWGMIYRRVQNRTVKPQFEFFLHRMIYAHILQLFHEYKPDLIVTTHPFPSAVVSRLKRMGLNIPLHTVITDYHVHGSWINTGVDYYYLPNHEAKLQMQQLGVSEKRLYITGIPTHPNFWNKTDKRKIRKKLGLSDRPTLLYMGGGLGIGLSPDMLSTIHQYRDEMQILIVTGRNRTLYRSLKLDPSFNHPHIHIYPFVKNIDELMDAADLLLTKPGGVTVAEAMAKGVPMIMLNPIPGQEEENYEYILQNQLGISVKDMEELNNLLEQFIKEPYMISKYFKSLSKTYNGRNAVEQIIKNA